VNSGLTVGQAHAYPLPPLREPDRAGEASGLRRDSL
jgi:hypothetical protein